MIETGSLQPYVLAGLGAAVAWLFKTIIQIGKDIVQLQTAFEYYIENAGKAAAIKLATPNPTPPEIRLLLDKFSRGILQDDERQILIDWARAESNDLTEDRDKRSAARQLLAALGSQKRSPKKRDWLGFTRHAHNL